MKVRILYKTPHRQSWQYVDGPTLAGAIDNLSREFIGIMELNDHIDCYYIDKFKIRLIR